MSVRRQQHDQVNNNTKHSIAASTSSSSSSFSPTQQQYPITFASAFGSQQQQQQPTTYTTDHHHLSPFISKTLITELVDFMTAASSDRRRAAHDSDTFADIFATSDNTSQQHRSKSTTMQQQQNALQLQSSTIGDNKTDIVACSQCAKLMQQRRLKTHLREVHTTERKHVCMECGIRFKCSGNLKRHQSVHSADTFACDLCPAACFTTQSKLSRHKGIFHRASGSHTCPICQQLFKTSGSLLRHQLRKHIDNRQQQQSRTSTTAP